MKMIGEREVSCIPSSEVLRSSPSACRKISNGHRPPQLPDYKSSVFSSLLPNEQNIYDDRRRPRGSMWETMQLARNSQRRGPVGGKKFTKQRAASAWPSAVESGILDNEQDPLLKPTNLDDDMEKIEEWCFSAHIVDRQRTCSEKVNKWLEESEHSDLTDLPDVRTRGPNEDFEIRGQLQRKEGCCLHHRSGRQTAKPLAESRIRKDNRAAGFRLAIAYLMTIMCISGVFSGFLMLIWSKPWDRYYPPPT